MSEKSLTQQKNNFYQRIRRWIYLKKLKTKKAPKYRELPDFLKADVEAIEIILQADINQVSCIPSGYFRKLSTKTQLKFLLLDFKKYSFYASDESIKMYVNDNPLLFDKLPEGTIQQMIKERPEIITKMPWFIQEKRKYSDNFFSNYFNIDNLINNPEEYIRRICAGRIKNFKPLNLTYLRDNQLRWRLGKYNPKYIEFVPIDWPENRMNLVDLLYEHAKELGENNKLCEYIKDCGDQSDIDENKRQILNRIGKMLVAEDVSKKISPGQINNFATEPTHKKLVEIIKTTYGETAASILEDRPQVTIELIPNFDVFRPEIIKEFGIGTLHALLTYDMPNAAAILGELARTPELMEKYKIFNKGTAGMFEDTAIGLDEKLEMFMDSLHLMDTVDFSQLTEAQKETLQIIMLDKKSKKTPEVIDFPKTEEELETYLERRKILYNEAIKKEQDSDQIKHLISRMHFGMDYEANEEINLNNLSVSDMLNIYRGEGFVNDVITTGSKDFSEDELDAMELLSIFSKIGSTKILQELADRMSKSEGIINPLTYKTLRKKIPLHYHKELQKQLITPEKALEMIENGEEGIRSEEIDGITVIYLEGHDFTALIHDPYQGMSNGWRPD